MSDRRQGRKQAVGELKRGLILAAARRVFEAEGLDGASLRAIAAAAGYTPAALYFHFDSKEAIYAEVLRASLARLGEAVESAVAAAATPAQRLRAAAMGFFGFYAENPGDLDLGFYLFRGGMKPKGLGRARDEALNAALAAALDPIATAAADLGASRGGGQAADGRCLRPCRRPAAAGPYRAHPHVRGLGAAADGGLYRGPDQAAQGRKAMTAIARESSGLLLIDLQARLMPAIAEAETVIANARRLLTAARLLALPAMLTEQNPKGLGPTVPELLAEAGNESSILSKQHFDACRAPGFFEMLPGRAEIVVAGCEAHVCVLQTALGLLEAGRRVHVVRMPWARAAPRARRRRWNGSPAMARRS